MEPQALKIVRDYANPLPRSFSDIRKHGKRIIAETDIRCGGRGAMLAKLLVFKDSKNLLRFWEDALGRPLCEDPRRGKTQGVVTKLASEIIRFTPDGEKRFTLVDPSYFCVIGLAKTHLTMEVICHEATHAGFAYAARHRRDFFVNQDHMDIPEEDVCYPSGMIAAGINRFLNYKGLYE